MVLVLAGARLARCFRTCPPEGDPGRLRKSDSPFHLWNDRRTGRPGPMPEEEKEMSDAGRVVLVKGASGGLGPAVGSAFAASGSTVIAVARSSGLRSELGRASGRERVE